MFSWQLLRDHGRPNHRTYYAKVEKTEILDPRTVRFDFPNANDRELPLILGLMPVLPKHAVDPATFDNTTLAKPVGTGPYVVSAVDTGKSVTFKRDPNYWGRDPACRAGDGEPAPPPAPGDLRKLPHEDVSPPPRPPLPSHATRHNRPSDEPAARAARPSQEVMTT